MSNNARNNPGQENPPDLRLPSRPQTTRPGGQIVRNTTRTQVPGLPLPLPPAPRPPVPVPMQMAEFHDRAVVATTANLPPRPNTTTTSAQNCATWWTNLPPNCTYSMLFQSIRSIGAVSNAVLYPPTNRSPTTSAASVEFFHHESVERLFLADGRGEITISGYKPIILPNRRHPSLPTPLHGSRILRITGPAKIITIKSLRALLDEAGLKYHLDFTKSQGNVVEMGFASFRNQALRAREILERQKSREDLSYAEKGLWVLVGVSFGKDPCE
ncbi:hypothetical protein GGS20DRAFT_483366 [Poronia punctata]|nr:hypothetical protein GGS20DRAFT_483366 [Poronia punctata]